MLYHKNKKTWFELNLIFFSTFMVNSGGHAGMVSYTCAQNNVTEKGLTTGCLQANKLKY